MSEVTSSSSSLLSVDLDSDLRGALEAILMVVSDPVAAPQIADVLGLDSDDVEKALETLSEAYAQEGRGFELRKVGGGWRFYSHPRFSQVVGAFVTAGHSNKLSVQALETLAVIAYKQPVTKAQIAAIRGVDVDSVVRTLLTRSLIVQVGATAATGAALYGTTDYFLERMGFNSLDELAPLAPYLPEGAEIDEIAEELQ